METKICTKCGRELPLENFSKDKRKKDGLRPECKECNKRYYTEHKKERFEYAKKYRSTPMGRASYLINSYNRDDNKRCRGKGDLTAEWIVSNIFTQKCAHCDETDWHKLGCNRLDNSKPHTKDNVEPCCEKCNTEIEWERKRIPVDQIDLETGEVINTFRCTLDAIREGYTRAGVVARGDGYKCKGFIFKHHKASYD